MDEYSQLYSEEDIRTKVVTAWLADHGFGPFEIRLGRKIPSIDSEKPKKNSSQIIRTRADVLVHRTDSKNLLIVEVKAPNEPLDNNVKEQGFSYARLLYKEGIAPFVAYLKCYKTFLPEHEAAFDDFVIQVSSFRKMLCSGIGAKEDLLKNFKYPHLTPILNVFRIFFVKETRNVMVFHDSAWIQKALYLPKL